MKKAFAILLTPMVLMGLVGCGGGETVQQETETTLPPVTGFVVPNPMSQIPEYSVSENPTVQELRETAVRAMHDMLSIQWCNDEEINYNKTGAVSHKNYHYDPNTTYCGLPYADGQTNIYVWLEYYDSRSGQMSMQGDGKWLCSIRRLPVIPSSFWKRENREPIVAPCFNIFYSTITALRRSGKSTLLSNSPAKVYVSPVDNLTKSSLARWTYI